MNICERLAAYVGRASWNVISPEARGKLKQHLLDALGCALGSVPSAVAAAIRNEQSDLKASGGPCSLIGGGLTTPERAAFYNAALIRCLNLADIFLAQGEDCHPSDNVAGILAGAEATGASGRDFLTALAIAYHVQCRLTASGGPLLRGGFENPIQLAIAQAAGLSHIYRLNEQQTAHAIALCAANCIGAGSNQRGVYATEWDGLSSAATAFQCMHNVRLARAGITGPLHVFDGPNGLEDVLSRHFSIDWDSENYDGILACSIKRYDAELDAQSPIEGILQLREEHHIAPEEVQGIHVDIFKAGYDRIGAGRNTSSAPVKTKEDASQSLSYLLSVALIDGAVGPEQFASDRIQAADVQSMMTRVVSWLSLDYTRAYPQSLKSKVRVGLKDGRILEIEKEDYEGFFRRPMPVDVLLRKFRTLARITLPERGIDNVISALAKLEERPIADLLSPLRTPVADEIRTEPKESQLVNA